MRRGKPMDIKITAKIEKAVNKMGTTTVQKIRTHITERYNVTYSWNTIRHHLDKLIELGIYKEIVISDDGRKVSIICKV